MSSKAQLQEYVKTLKKEITFLKKKNISKNDTLSATLRLTKQLEVEINRLKLNQRKWYHFF